MNQEHNFVVRISRYPYHSDYPQFCQRILDKLIEQNPKCVRTALELISSEYKSYHDKHTDRKIYPVDDTSRYGRARVLVTRRLVTLAQNGYDYDDRDKFYRPVKLLRDRVVALLRRGLDPDKEIDCQFDRGNMTVKFVHKEDGREIELTKIDIMPGFEKVIHTGLTPEKNDMLGELVNKRLELVRSEERHKMDKHRAVYEIYSLISHWTPFDRRSATAARLIQLWAANSAGVAVYPTIEGWDCNMIALTNSPVKFLDQMTRFTARDSSNPRLPESSESINLWHQTRGGLIR